MAKKVAVSTNHLVLDIPVGPTMKIRHFKDADKISRKFENLAKKFAVKIIVDINQSLEPAGRGVGPALEARDVLNVLEQKKERPLALEVKALRLAGKLLSICYLDAKKNLDGEEEARKLLYEGKALAKFREIVRAQGGDDQITHDRFKIKGQRIEIKSKKSGKIKSINNYNLNMIAKILGAPQDKYAGIFLCKKIDEETSKKDVLMEFHSTNSYKLEEAKVSLENFPIYEIEA